MSEKEIAVQIRSNDAHFLAVPPRCGKWYPVRSPNETRNGHAAISVTEGPRPNLVKCALNWVRLLHDG